MSTEDNRPETFRILLVTAEFWPFSKTGGLADMTAALAKYLARQGHHVQVLTPFYRCVMDHPDLPILYPVMERVPIHLDRMSAYVDLLQARIEPRLWVTFLRAPEFFDRPGIYEQIIASKRIPYPDNAERFSCLAQSATLLARHAAPPPDIVHVHDWHCAPAALMIKHLGWYEGWYEAPATVLTIHNLEYQGRFPAGKFWLWGLPAYYMCPDGAEFYGGVNFLKAGIAFADAITTVSPTYAKQILEPRHGWGLDGILRKRQFALFGILNGVDYEVWQTENNRWLYAPYNRSDLSGKQINKRELQRELGLPINDQVALFGTISRIEFQKGIDLILDVLPSLPPNSFQYVLLGTGDPELAERARKLSQEMPGRFVFIAGYNEPLAHRIEAGCDFYLMPSRYEPCGLNQMYSLRYGTIPIVHATGGLADTVIDESENPDQATGIKFFEATTKELHRAITRALELFKDAKRLQQMRIRGMHQDFSWRRAAETYAALYRKVLRRRLY